VGGPISSTPDEEKEEDLPARCAEGTGKIKRKKKVSLLSGEDRTRRNRHYIEVPLPYLVSCCSSL